MLVAAQNAIRAEFTALRNGQPKAVFGAVEKTTLAALVILSYLVFTGHLKISTTTFGLMTLALGSLQFGARVKKLKLETAAAHVHPLVFVFEAMTIVGIAVQTIMAMSVGSHVRSLGSSVFSTYLTYSLLRMLYAGIRSC